MRELYILGCGLVLGVYLADWLERYERRLAWQAADFVEERDRERRRFERGVPPIEPATPADQVAPAA